MVGGWVGGEDGVGKIGAGEGEGKMGLERWGREKGKEGHVIACGACLLSSLLMLLRFYYITGFLRACSLPFSLSVSRVVHWFQLNSTYLTWQPVCGVKARRLLPVQRPYSSMPFERSMRVPLPLLFRIFRRYLFYSSYCCSPSFSSSSSSSSSSPSLYPYPYPYPSPSPFISLHLHPHPHPHLLSSSFIPTHRYLPSLPIPFHFTPERGITPLSISGNERD